MNLINISITALYFILPAYMANMSPLFANKLRLPFGIPISEKLFGKNKTWRGIYTGIIGAILCLLLQRYLQSKGIFDNYRLLDYNSINIFFYGFLFGFGALGGDALKSFIKRRIGIAPGKPWVPFDQLDLIVGALLLIYPFYHLDLKYIIVLLILSPLLHSAVNVMGYLSGFKKVWW